MRKIFVVLIFNLIINSYAIGQDDINKFEKVFDVIGSQRIFDLSFNKLMQELNGLCKQSTRSDKEQDKYGNVECIKEVGVDLFFISGGGNIGFVQTSFLGADRCAYVKKVLIKNFGAPSKTTNECALDWRLKPLKKGGPQRYVGFEVNKGKDKIYFSIGEEQGP